jgi:hypothetical protein
LSADAGCRDSAASAVMVEAFDRPVAMAPPAGEVPLSRPNCFTRHKSSSIGYKFVAAPVEFREALCLLAEAADGGDVQKRETAAVHAAAAVGALISLSKDAEEVADGAAQEQKEQISMFTLLHSNMLPNTSGQCQPSPTSRGSTVDIQARRILDLEAALQAERDAQIRITRQCLHQQHENERDAMERALRSVPSTPRIVEAPRNVSHDMEQKELLRQLHQARAESNHFRSEYEKFVASYEALGSNLTSASARLEAMMQVGAWRNPTQNKPQTCCKL